MLDHSTASKGSGGSDDAIVINDSVTNGREATLIIVAMVIIAMAIRPGIASIGPVLPLISREFSLSHVAASLLTTIPTLLMGVLAPPTPWLARWLGRSWVLLVSLVLLLISMVVRSFATNVLVLLVTTAGVGTGIAVAGTLFAGIVKASFPGKVAMMMSVYAVSLSFSTTLSAAATGPIAAIAGEYGWRLGTGIWSPLALVAIFAAIAILVMDKRKVAVARPGHARAAGLPLTNRTAWLVALFFACDNFVFFALLAWTAPLYLEQGMSAAAAHLVLTTVTVPFTVAIPVFGLLSRGHDRRGWLTVCGVFAGAGTLGLALAPLLSPHVWTAAAAFGLGGGFTLGMTLPLDSARNTDEANTWNAFTMTIGYLVAAAGPLLVGLLRDATGTFAAPLWLLFIVASGMLVLTPFLAPHRHAE
jgi:CP family cyanate transporter-like MFS transporter